MSPRIMFIYFRNNMLIFSLDKLTTELLKIIELKNEMKKNIQSSQFYETDLNLTNIVHLNWSGYKLKTIEPGLFCGLGNLKILILASNLFKICEFKQQLS